MEYFLHHTAVLRSSPDEPVTAKVNQVFLQGEDHSLCSEKLELLVKGRDLPRSGPFTIVLSGETLIELVQIPIRLPEATLWICRITVSESIVDANGELMESFFAPLHFDDIVNALERFDPVDRRKFRIEFGVDTCQRFPQAFL